MDVKQLSLCYFNSHSSVEEHSYIGLRIISNSSFMNSHYCPLASFLKSFYWVAKYVYIFKVTTCNFVYNNFICFRNLTILFVFEIWLYTPFHIHAGGIHFYVTIFINLPSFGVMFIKFFPILRLCKYSTIYFLLELALIQFLFIILISLWCNTDICLFFHK